MTRRFFSQALENDHQACDAWVSPVVANQLLLSMEKNLYRLQCLQNSGFDSDALQHDIATVKAFRRLAYQVVMGRELQCDDLPSWWKTVYGHVVTLPLTKVGCRYG